MIDWVTVAPVARRNAGARMLRWASFQVPGKVAATSVFASANARAGRMEAAPSAAAPVSKRLRSMVLTPLPFISCFGKHTARRVRCGRHVHAFAGSPQRRCRLAGLAHLERGAALSLHLVDDYPRLRAA